ncbi:hypothetical protein GCM10009642_56610 [Nocardiopsis metallicus]
MRHLPRAEALDVYRVWRELSEDDGRPRRLNWSLRCRVFAAVALARALGRIHFPAVVGASAPL